MAAVTDDDADGSDGGDVGSDEEDTGGGEADGGPGGGAEELEPEELEPEDGDDGAAFVEVAADLEASLQPPSEGIDTHLPLPTGGTAHKSTLIAHKNKNPHLSNDRLTRVCQAGRPAVALAPEVAPASLMVGLGSDVAINVAGGIGWKLGRVQQMTRFYGDNGKSKTSYIHDVSLVHKPKGLMLYCNWYQPARGGMYAYTLSDINPVSIDTVIRKVDMQQERNTNKYRLGREDKEHLTSGDWREEREGSGGDSDSSE